jgi:ribonuclease R
MVEFFIIRSTFIKNRSQGTKTVRGVAKRHPDGFGFLIATDQEFPDVYIPRNEMTGIMTNDEVIARVYPERGPGKGRFRGEIAEIVKRAHSRIVGRVQDVGGGRFMMRDTSHAWGADLAVDREEVINQNIKESDWVLIEITDYPDSQKGFKGKIIKSIGNVNDANTDNMRVLAEHQIPYEFSKKAIEESEQIETRILEEEIKHRKDLRKMPLVTIDGQTAKDFDDAIYVEKTTRGFRLVVAIADVSHYVRPGSLIDEEAYDKGTSTYFPGFVSPMLPEALSNELCSLKPKVDRLSFVADMEFDFTGERIGASFYEAVICSHARLTYGQAQEIIEGAKNTQTPEVETSVLLATDLAKILLQKRIKEGSLELEIPETYVEIDEKGQPVDISKSHRLFAHRLIEEMMLSANVAVADKFMETSTPALYRVHDTPEEDNIFKLEKFLLKMGSRIKFGSGKLQKKLREVLDQHAGHREETVLNMMTLRSMKQAQYSSENRGHFGLSFKNYSHFTSPIRRYPDLIVHRQLKALVTKRGYKLIPEGDLATDGTFLSSCEQRSVKAERQLLAIKKARFMEKFTGQEFEGVISTVTKFGVFVLLKTYDVDGLIRLDELGGERFEFDEESLRLVGTRSGFSFSIGDPIKIKVLLTDPLAGRIDFAWISEQKSVENKGDSRKKNHRGQDSRRDQKRGERGRGGDERRAQSGKAASKSGGKKEDYTYERESRRPVKKDDKKKNKKFNKDYKHGSSNKSDKKMEPNSQHKKATTNSERTGEPRVSGPDRKGKAGSLFLKASYRSRSKG